MIFKLKNNFKKKKHLKLKETFCSSCTYLIIYITFNDRETSFGSSYSQIQLSLYTQAQTTKTTTSGEFLAPLHSKNQCFVTHVTFLNGSCHRVVHKITPIRIPTI